jgi:glycosyltransferase involved in cell wall biosynthesis
VRDLNTVGTRVCRVNAMGGRRGSSPRPPSTTEGEHPDRPLRVLQVIDGLRFGGAQTVLLALLRLSRSRGLETYVANAGRRYDAQTVAQARALSDGLVLHSGRALWDARALVRLVRAIRRRDIDVVHAHLAGAEVLGGWAARLTRRPVVTTLHSVYEGRLRGQGGFPPVRRRLADHATRRLADHVIAVSGAVKDSYVSELGLPPDKVTVVRNAIAQPAVPSGFDRSAKRGELDVGAGPLIVSLSRLTAARDHATLLRAIPAVRARYPSLRVLILSDGPRAEPLRALTRELGLEGPVRLLGFREDAFEIVASCDVFVHPTFVEGLPTALLEAMGLGVPVVASRVAGTEEVLEDEVSGVLVDPGDVAGWEGALTGLLGSPDRRRRIAEEGRRRAAADFDSERWIRQIEAIYRRVARDSA